MIPLTDEQCQALQRTGDREALLYPDDGSNYPRLPLPGLKALADNHLHLTVSGWRRSAWLRTRRRWWPFG